MKTISTIAFAWLFELMLMLIRRKKYELTYSQLFTIYAVTLVSGIIAALGASYLETGRFGGIRYYGTVFCTVIALYPTAKLIGYPYFQLMNFAAAEGMLVIAVVKINCIRQKCCAGRVLFETENGVQFIFPSQIIELFTAVLVMIALLAMERNKNSQKYILPTYLIMYGLTRFVFDSLRADQGRILSLGLINISVGHLFCIAIMAIGLFSLIKVK